MAREPLYATPGSVESRRPRKLSGDQPPSTPMARVATRYLRRGRMWRSNTALPRSGQRHCLPPRWRALNALARAVQLSYDLRHTVIDHFGGHRRDGHAIISGDYFDADYADRDGFEGRCTGNERQC